MTDQPEPEPQERDAPPERLRDEEAMRGPGHHRPDEVMEDVGLEDEREPAPEGAPLPLDPDRSRPVPLDEDG